MLFTLFKLIFKTIILVDLHQSLDRIPVLASHHCDASHLILGVAQRAHSLFDHPPLRHSLSYSDTRPVSSTAEIGSLDLSGNGPARLTAVSLRFIINTLNMLLNRIVVK